MISAIIELYAVGPDYKKSILFEEIGDTAWKSLIEEVILGVAHDERVEKNYVKKSHSWQAHVYASRCKTCAGMLTPMLHWSILSCPCTPIFLRSLGKVCLYPHLYCIRFSNL